MRLSIYNFKSIGSVVNYEIKPFIILSGTNSSGKSSFIQLLLLIKQTLEDDSAQRPLFLKGEYYFVRDFLDILKDRDKSNKLKIEFVFQKSELLKYKDDPGFTLYHTFDDYQLHISITFDLTEDNQKVIVSSFEIKFVNEREAQRGVTFFENSNNTEYKITSNQALLISGNLFYSLKNGNSIIKKINYSAFFPTEMEVEYIEPSVELPNGEWSKESKVIVKEVPKLDSFKTILKEFFSNLNYVGPLRIAPKDDYNALSSISSVGIDGKNVAQTLCQQSDRIITFYKLQESGDECSFLKSENTFISALKYWLCERFKLCKDIYSKKVGDIYIINVVSLSNITSTIKHVGFGISQILPIIVEGLKIKDNETLILEQPEIHLHPKVQSDVADFLLSLVIQGKKVILETHSDHLITRLRRRIAEDYKNHLDSNIQLTFVEVASNDVIFRNININDIGIIELPYPTDFIERTDIELKALLKAQMNKRINQEK